MSVHFCDAGSTMLVSGPAKINLVSDDAPITATRPAPTIGSLSPNTAVHGEADVTVTITGTNFSQFTRAQVSGVDVATTYVDPTHVSFLMPVSQQAAAGAVPVTTRNGNKVSAPSNFTYT
jgi:hypothetical protein